MPRETVSDPLAESSDWKEPPEMPGEESVEVRLAEVPPNRDVDDEDAPPPARAARPPPRAAPTIPRPRSAALALPIDVPPGEETGAPDGMAPAWQQEGNQSLAARRASKQQASVPPWANAYPSGPLEPVDSNLAMTSTTRVCPGAPGGVIAVSRDERTPTEKALRLADLRRQIEELETAEA